MIFVGEPEVTWAFLFVSFADTFVAKKWAVAKLYLTREFADKSLWPKKWAIGQIWGIKVATKFVKKLYYCIIELYYCIIFGLFLAHF